MKHPTPQAIARNVEIIRKRTRNTDDDAVADWMETQAEK